MVMRKTGNLCFKFSLGGGGGKEEGEENGEEEGKEEKNLASRSTSHRSDNFFITNAESNSLHQSISQEQ